MRETIEPNRAEIEASSWGSKKTAEAIPVSGSAAEEQNQAEGERRDRLAVLLAEAELAPDESARKEAPFEPLKSDKDPRVMRQAFARLATTRDLEFGTARTDILQGIVDKMLPHNWAEEPWRSRVVIMRQGQQNEAFVFGDGSMFISQHLINNCRTLDEVGAVLAHECGHLVLRTHEKIDAAIAATDGINWTHEGLSDVLIKEHLAQAGLSTKGARILSRLSDAERRDVAHMASGVRSSLSAATERLVDYGEASERGSTPLPENLRGPTRPTNLEIARELIGNHLPEIGADALAPLLPKLDQADFLDYLQTWKSKPWGSILLFETPSNLPALAQCAYREMVNRAQAAGLPDDAKTHVLLTVLGKEHFLLGQLSSGVFPHLNIKELLAGDFTMSKTAGQDSLDRIFAARPFVPSPENSLAEIISHHVFDRQRYPDKPDQVPADSVTDVIRVMKGFSQNPPSPSSRQENMTALLRWLTTSFGAKATPGEGIAAADEEKIRAICRECKKNVLPFRLSPPDSPTEFFDGRQILTISPANRNRIMEIIVPELDLRQQEYDPSRELGELQGSLLSFQTSPDPLEEWPVPGFRTFELSPAATETLARGVEQALVDWEIPAACLENAYKDLTGQPVTDPDEAVKLVKEVWRLRLNTKMIRADGDDLYDWQNRTPFGQVDWHNYSTLLLKRVVGQVYYHEFGVWQPEKFSELPLVKELLSRPDDVPVRHGGDSVTSLKSPSGRSNLFGVTANEILFYRHSRQELRQQLDQPWPVPKLAELFQSVEEGMPNTAEKHRWLSAITQRYLHSPDVSFAEKAKYLGAHLDFAGPEGMIILAEQATTQKDYGLMRNQTKVDAGKYLKENPRTEALAVADYLGSRVTARNPAAEVLIDTCGRSPDDMKHRATTAVETWFQNLDYWGVFKGVGQGAIYDAPSRKFWLNNLTSRAFMTPADTFARLHQTSGAERFMAVLKSLLDEGGSLTSPAKREVLGQKAVTELELSGFMNEFFRQLVAEGDADQISVPLASFLSPMLFRGLDIKAVDYSELRQALIRRDLEGLDLDVDHLRQITTSDTRQMTSYGAVFAHHPDCALSKEAQKSWADYQAIGDRLNEILVTPEAGAAEPEAPPAGTVAGLIKAGETNPLTNRAMQLAVQLFPELGPEVREQMSECLDSNPVVNKLLFWENLQRLTIQSYSHEGFDRGLQTALANIDSVDKRAGAGSLFTTYFGQYRTERDQTQAVVIKLLNPNPEQQVKDNFVTLYRTLSKIITTSPDREMTRIAGKCQQVLRMTYKWCLHDVRDEKFMPDDAAFRQTAEAFNKRDGRAAVVVPEVFFNNKRLKIEARAAGQTLKEFLKNPDTTPKQKQQTQKLVYDFYKYQMSHPTPEGEFILHSDPHAGNFIVEIAPDGQPRLSVIDRSLYLHFQPNEMPAFRDLLAGHSVKFVHEYARALCDRRAGSAPSKVRIYARLATKLAKLKLQRSDDMEMLIAVNDVLTKAGVQIPYEWQLMTRNARLIREMKKK